MKSRAYILIWLLKKPYIISISESDKRKIIRKQTSDVKTKPFLCVR